MNLREHRGSVILTSLATVPATGAGKECSKWARMQVQYGINTPSTPPLNESGDNNWGGVDTDVELSDSWWERVKYYARLAIERVECGVEYVKVLLSTLTIDERLGVMLEFENLNVTRQMLITFGCSQK